MLWMDHWHPRPVTHLFSDADVHQLYGDSVSWVQFEEEVDAMLSDSQSPSTDGEFASPEVFEPDGIQAQVALLNFSTVVGEYANIRKVAMALGSITASINGCELFEETHGKPLSVD